MSRTGYYEDLPVSLENLILGEQGENLCTKPAIQWGRDNEKTAKEKFEAVKGLTVAHLGTRLNPSGVLAATPDGLCSDGCLLEIKCPYSAKDMSVREAVAKKVVKYLLEQDGSGELDLDSSSEYYYQVCDVTDEVLSP